ncbi:MAG: CoA transferase [Phycicoccus sp.]|nr:CoA transferase [Phycicoccus sp.]
MRHALAGIRVIAIEHAVAAPLCTRHLADLGADVIKIEKPQYGDFARDYDGFVRGHSSHFVWLNRGKRSVAIDLKSGGGRHILLELLRTADVLVCNLAPGALERIVADAELGELNPRLVRCYLSGYGTSGPYAGRKAYDLLVQGEAGTIAATGTPEQRAKPGVSLSDLSAGTYALAAINAALIERSRTGRGQRLDISLFEVLLEWMSPLLLTQKYTGQTPDPVGLGHASIVPYGPYTTSDSKQILLAVQTDGQWRRLCTDVLKNTALIADPALATNAGRLRNRARVESVVQESLSAMSLALVTDRLEAADVPHARLNQVVDVVDHPQAMEAGRWSPTILSDGQEVEVVTSPFHTTPDLPGATRVPGLGEHTDEVLKELGLTTFALDGQSPADPLS